MPRRAAAATKRFSGSNASTTSNLGGQRLGGFVTVGIGAAGRDGAEVRPRVDEPREDVFPGRRR